MIIRLGESWRRFIHRLARQWITLCRGSDCHRIVVKQVWLAAMLMLAMTACQTVANPSPEPTATITHVPTVTSTMEPTPVSPGAHWGEVEGLVILDEAGQLIVGVNWLSKSRVTYVVKGGDVEGVKKLLGEMVRVAGEIVDCSPWRKEIVVHAVEASTASERLSRRVGYIKELGPSIYMQGTHVLVDREGKLICLLSAAPDGPDLDQYIMRKVAVIGVLSKTVEGNAQIMKVALVEPVRS